MRKMVICIFLLVWPVMGNAHAKDAMVYFNLGLESGMTYKKIEYLTKALELNPKLAAAYENRGMLYYFLEKYDMMIQDFQTYIGLVPATNEEYRMLGVGYLKTGLFKAAISSSFSFKILVRFSTVFAKSGLLRKW